MPYENLKEKLNDEERQQLFWTKATNEDVIDNILKVNIINKEILSSFVINILKRAAAKPKINISENVIQIPYLFDPETSFINSEAIDYIGELYC